MQIIKEPDKILHHKLNQVNEITPDIKALISGMRKAMQANNGVGLSANQVGENLMIFVIDENLAKENNVPDGKDRCCRNRCRCLSGRCRYDKLHFALFV